MTLTRDQLVSARPQFKTLSIGTLGEVRIRSLMQRDYYEILKCSLEIEGRVGSHESERPELMQGKLLSYLYPLLVAYAVVDDNGDPLFQGPDDAALNSFRPVELAAIGNAIYEFWGFNEVATIEAEVKNSEAVLT